jgi:hypothetical protein
MWYLKNIAGYFLILILLFPAFSCRKLKDYFRDPETEPLAESIQAAVMTGKAANLAMAIMEGRSFPMVTCSRSNPGFPCTTLMVYHVEEDPVLFFDQEKATTITIAGLWPDESTAILSLLFSDYNSGTSTFDLFGIQTIPVIRDADHIQIALAGMDIKLNPEQDALLRINLNTLEIESELIRLEAPLPPDIYVAVTQDAYLIDVNNNATGNDISDDEYSITGGGQLIKAAGSSAEIRQLAMFEVQVSAWCTSNPTGGMALMKTTGVEDQGFPELGTAVFEFIAECTATAHVYVATGMYAGSNLKTVPFHL